MDVSPLEALALPVLTPLYGFATISAPSYDVETYEVNIGNGCFTRQVIKCAKASNMTLTQGVTFYNSDFWRWTLAAITGDTGGVGSSVPFLTCGGATYRRNLVLIHYFARATFGTDKAAQAAELGVLAGAAGVGALMSGAGALSSLLTASIVGGVGLIAEAATGWQLFAPRIPAKMYILQGVIPIKYKPASDFDAQSGEVSLAELEIAMDSWEEVAVGA